MAEDNDIFENDFEDDDGDFIDDDPFAENYHESIFYDDYEDFPDDEEDDGFGDFGPEDLRDGEE